MNKKYNQDGIRLDCIAIVIALLLLAAAVARGLRKDEVRDHYLPPLTAPPIAADSPDLFEPEPAWPKFDPDNPFGEGPDHE